VIQITGKPNLAAPPPQNVRHFKIKTHDLYPIALIPPTMALVSSHPQHLHNQTAAQRPGGTEGK
jgi:hypothetical protein